MAEKESEGKIYFPFSSYDFFGYLIPGGIFFLTVFIFDYWAYDSMTFKHNPIWTLVRLFKPINENNHLNTFDSIAFILASLLVIYVIGHIIAALSSFFIDRMLIKKGHFYPIKSILIGQSRNDEGEKSIKGLFVLFNFSLGLLYGLSSVYLAIAYSVYKPITLYWHIILGAIFFLLIYSFVFMFSYSLTLKFTPKFYIIYNWLLNRLKSVIGNDDELSKKTLKRYKKFLKYELKIKPRNISSDPYWFSYSYIMRKSPSSNKLLINWLHLYSFARNLSTGFYLSFLYCTLSIGFNSHFVQTNSFGEIYKFKVLVGILIPLTYWILSILFLLRFYYLYRSYYSKYVIRACVFLYDQSKGNSEL